MMWLIFPIAAFVAILIIVVKDYCDRQQPQQRNDSIIYDDTDDEPRVYEFETTDEKEIL